MVYFSNRNKPIYNQGIGFSFQDLA